MDKEVRKVSFFFLFHFVSMHWRINGGLIVADQHNKICVKTVIKQPSRDEILISLHYIYFIRTRSLLLTTQGWKDMIFKLLNKCSERQEALKSFFHFLLCSNKELPWKFIISWNADSFTKWLLFTFVCLFVF